MQNETLHGLAHTACHTAVARVNGVQFICAVLKSKMKRKTFRNCSGLSDETEYFIFFSTAKIRYLTRPRNETTSLHDLVFLHTQRSNYGGGPNVFPEIVAYLVRVQRLELYVLLTIHFYLSIISIVVMDRKRPRIVHPYGYYF